MGRPISISLSPNTQRNDVWLAATLLFQPWLWKKGDAIARTERWFTAHFSGYQAVSFNSGRSALLAILRAFGIGKGDEVIVQAFTCVAVPNSVLWCGATPVYTDIDQSLTIDPAGLEKRITPRTKAIIVQHTFGILARIERIKAIARKHGLYVIEDCAHILDVSDSEAGAGSYGDAAFFSFGRDKAVSSVFGGMAIIRNRHGEACNKLSNYWQSLDYPPLHWIGQQLFHPVAFWFILPLYTIGIGKLLLLFLQTIQFLSFPVYKEEKRGGRPKYFPARYPNALALLLMLQLSKIRVLNNRRKRATSTYTRMLAIKKDSTAISISQGGTLLRYPISVSSAKQLLTHARAQGILLGNWYHHIIDPDGVDFQSVFYRKGSCPKAEYAASHIINLPTNIAKENIERIVSAL